MKFDDCIIINISIQRVNNLFLLLGVVYFIIRKRLIRDGFFLVFIFLVIYINIYLKIKGNKERL